MTSAWKTDRLGSVVIFQRGFDLPRRLRRRGNVPIVTSSGVEEFHSEAMVRGPGVVTGRYGTIGEVFFVETDFWPLNTTLYVREFHGNDARFISYLLRTIDYASHSGKSGVPGVNRNDLHELFVSLPNSCAEQRAIAEALSDADALIESLSLLLAKKRQIKRGAMQALLTGKRRLPGFSGEWEVRQLGDVADCLDNLRSPLNDAQRSKRKGAYPYCGANGVLDYIDDYCIDDSVILIAEDGGYFDEYATRPIAYRMSGKFWVNNHAHILKSKAQFDQGFLFYSLVHKNVLSFLASGTRAKLNKSQLNKIVINQPTAWAEQSAIAAALGDMDTELAALETKLAKVCDIKQGMAQALLTGRIRLVCLASNVIPLPVRPAPADPQLLLPAHNWQINEAVLIGVLAQRFGTEKFPLPRKRRVKLMYLLHRHAEGRAEGYLKKAAGPYDPNTKYKGPETIALKNGYVRALRNGTYEGFVAGDQIEQAQRYFEQWYGEAALAWLERFHYRKTDELELLATVDMAMVDLGANGEPVDVTSVKRVIAAHSEWLPKLSRELFSDERIAAAITECQTLFGG